MNPEEKFDTEVELLESKKVEINASDFGLSERDGTNANQDWFPREYMCRPVDNYNYMHLNAPAINFLDGYHTAPGAATLNARDIRDYTYYYDENMRGYDRTLYHRDGQNPEYSVRPTVINVERDLDSWDLLERPFYYYRSSTVKFEVYCPSCNGRNEITVAEYVIMRNPNPRITCVCGASLVIEGGW